MNGAAYVDLFRSISSLVLRIGAVAGLHAGIVIGMLKLEPAPPPPFVEQRMEVRAIEIRVPSQAPVATATAPEPIKPQRRIKPLSAHRAQPARPVPAATPPAVQETNAVASSPILTVPVSESAALPPSLLPAPEPVQAAVLGPRFDADYLQNPEPAYPQMSRRMREAGKVLLRVRVNPTGEPENIEITSGSGFPRLDQAAVDTVQRWKFVPARRGDEAVTANVLVPIVFRLDS